MDKSDRQSIGAGSEPLLYNSRIVNNYVRFLQRNYPDIDTHELLASAGMEVWQVADQGHWFSQRQVNEFHHRMDQLTGNRELPREVGRATISSEAMGAFRHYMVSLLSLAQVYAMVGKLAGKITRSSTYACRSLGRNRVEITVTPQPGVVEGEFQCQSRIGSFESPALFFTGEYPSIVHSECQFNGGKVCRYEISWKDGFPLASHRLRYLGYTGLVVGGGVALLGLSGLPFWLALAALPTLALGLNLLGARQELRRMSSQLENQRDTHARLLDQIDLTYKNAQLNSELGQVVNLRADLDQTLKNILQVLAERTDFARCMVFLAEPSGGCLGFAEGYGWSAQELAGLRQTRFSLGGIRLADASSRPAVLAAGKGELESLVSALTPGLRMALNLQSLVACPIVADQALIGLLVIDQLKNQRALLQSDVSVMLGVAPVIGMNLHNHRLIEELELNRQSLAAEVELRTADLREALVASHELAQRAEAASLTKSRFLANMSHEIRTPLMGVLGMNEVLLESGLTPEQRSLASTVQESGERLLELLNDILDLSKVEAGKLTLEHLRFLPLETVELAVASLADLAHGKGLELILQLAAISGLEVEGDPRRLRQVLLNLVGNAIKFTAVGEVVVRAELIQLGLEAVTVRFSISDTGIGIEPGAQATIFENFSQADSSTSRQYGGSGLGLAIVRQLVALMGGSLGFQSELGAGSCFWFTLPLKLTGNSSKSAPGHLTTGRVLLVTASTALADGLRDHVRQSGLDLVRAADIVAAQARLASDTGPWSLVLVALGPSLDWSVLREFRTHLVEMEIPLALLGSRRELTAAQGEFGPDILQLHKPVRQHPLKELLLVSRGPAAVGTLPMSDPLHRNGPAFSGVGRRILLVEDNVTTRDLVAAMTARLDSQLVAVDCGERALALWAVEPFDLVLMDCQMPGLDGYETTARLRALGCRAPIVALTARAQWDDPQRCLDAGMDDYLSKPFKQKDLLAMILHWLPGVVGEAGAPGGGNELLL